MPRSDLENREIAAVLESGLREKFGQQRSIARLHRQEYGFRSSYQLDELIVELDDGLRLDVLFKDLSPRAMPLEIKRMRPDFLYSPEREIHVYTQFLAKLPVRTAVCYAAKVDRRLDRYWLFLEKVAGKELYQFGQLAVWEEAARWLARFHRLGANLQFPAGDSGPLDWDRASYQQTLELAKRHRREGLHDDDGKDQRFHRIAAVYVKAVERILAQPKRLIHGEFFASNVLVQEDTSGYVICPIDWETIGWGPPLIDLAALIAGRWGQTERTAMTQAYWLTLDQSQRVAWNTLQDFQTALVACRLHLALQMLGRPQEWKPPAEHKQDWFLEAELLSEQLESQFE